MLCSLPQAEGLKSRVSIFFLKLEVAVNFFFLRVGNKSKSLFLDPKILKNI